MLLKNINNEFSGLVISDGFNLTIVEYTAEKAIIFFVVVPLVFHIKGLLVQFFFVIFFVIVPLVFHIQGLLVQLCFIIFLLFR